MESSANFIPLEGGRRTSENPREITSISRTSSRPANIIGETAEDRKRIAREIRQAAKKEKKKGKQDAKKARKENGILHRRLNRNDEKYVKNQDRNRQRNIDLERRAIQDGAVKQAEQLAAKHDPSGKMFNVGELVIMPDGQVKSKQRLREAEESKERRAQEAADYEAKIKKANDGFKEARALKEVELAAKGKEMSVYEVQMLRKRFPVPSKISKKQLARREIFAPRPPPVKPVIPEGFSIPEGEEDLLALWDITDEELIRRVNRRKKDKTQAAKALRKLQKEKKKFNRAMKMIKKQCAVAGVVYDVEKARKEVLGMMSEASDSGSDDDEDSDDENEDEDKNGNTAGSGLDSDSDSDSSSDSDSEAEEEAPKKTKAELRAETALTLKGGRPKINLELLAKANEFEQALKQKKREKRDKRRAERKAEAEKAAADKLKLEKEKKALEEAEKKTRKTALNGAKSGDNSSKKRKRSRDEEDEEAVKKAEKKAKKAAKKAKEAEVESKPEDIVMQSEPKEPEEDAEAKAAREKSERKKARKAEKALAAKSEPDSEDDEAKAKRERKEARKAEKAAKAKPAAESNDDKLDQTIAERETKIKTRDISAPNVDQWNPEALGGDDARKSKFMRLLGAGKKNVDVGNVKREKGEKDAKKTVEQISKVQSELERQYEMGMRMKHDGGGKRRGLGA